MILHLEHIQLVHMSLKQLQRLPERVEIPSSLAFGSLLASGFQVGRLDFPDELGLCDERLLVGGLTVDGFLTVGVESMEEGDFKALWRTKRSKGSQSASKEGGEGRRGG